MSDLDDPTSFPDVPVMQALLDIIPGTLHVKDRALRYCVVNRYFLESWGLEPRAVIGKRSDEVFGDRYDPDVERRDRQVLTSGTALPFYEVEYPTRLSERVSLWATKVPLLDATGTPTHVLTLGIDITQLKRAERALNESEKVRSATVWRAMDAIVAIDETGTIIEFNPAAEQLFGYRRDDVLGVAVHQCLIPPAHRAGHLAGMRRFAQGALSARGGRRFESEGLRADGSVFPIEIAVAEIALDGRSLFTAYVRDLSAQRSVQAQLVAQREALHRSAKLSAMGTLVASISHELKNPLSVVVGQALLLCETSDDQRVADRAARIGTAAKRCAHIVNNFLDMARQHPVRMVATHLDSIVDTALELTEHLLEGAEITIERVRGENLPMVSCDPHQLGQVLMNLIVNAEQAMAAAPPARRLTLTTRRTPDGLVALDVADTGPGITETVAERLFTPFVTTRDDGTGLGLAICKDIVSAHGGHISAANAPAAGAVFTVTLPPTPAGTAEAVTAGPPTAHGCDVRVLVVDDEVSVLETLAEILDLGGYRVDAATSAEQALEDLKLNRYDAVLSDMRMPGVDGIEFFEALCVRDPVLAGRFAYVTGDMLTPTARAFIEKTGARTLQKPFTPGAVLALVEALLGDPGSGQPAEPPAGTP